MQCTCLVCGLRVALDPQSENNSHLLGQLQRFYKLMSCERAFKMLKNDMCITEIRQAVLEL